MQNSYLKDCSLRKKGIKIKLLIVNQNESEIKTDEIKEYENLQNSIKS